MSYTESQLRRIDALVAEKIMGWGWAIAKGTNVSVLMPPLTYQDETQHAVIWERGRTSQMNYITGRYFDSFKFAEFAHYATDHNAVAEMRGRLREMGKHIAFGIAIAHEVAAVFESQSGSREDEQFVFADDMCDILDATPLQQCLAALAACGVDVERELAEVVPQ